MPDMRSHVPTLCKLSCMFECPSGGTVRRFVVPSPDCEPFKSEVCKCTASERSDHGTGHGRSGKVPLRCSEADHSKVVPNNLGATSRLCMRQKCEQGKPAAPRLGHLCVLLPW